MAGLDSIKLALSDGALLDVANITDIGDQGLIRGAGVTVTLHFYG